MEQFTHIVAFWHAHAYQSRRSNECAPIIRTLCKYIFINWLWHTDYHHWGFISVLKISIIISLKCNSHHRCHTMHTYKCEDHGTSQPVGCNWFSHCNWENNERNKKQQHGQISSTTVQYIVFLLHCIAKRFVFKPQPMCLCLCVLAQRVVLRFFMSLKIAIKIMLITS